MMTTSSEQRSEKGKRLREVRSTVRVIKRTVIDSNLQAPEEDFLAIEDPLAMELHFSNDQAKPNDTASETILSMRTPGQDKELIYGFLYSEGIIEQASDLISVTFNRPLREEAPFRAQIVLHPDCYQRSKKAQRNSVVQASCGVCGSAALPNIPRRKLPKSASILRVPAHLLHDLPRKMENHQKTFRRTGGLHASALFDSKGQLESLYEDIGRHNALDKLIGNALLHEKLPLKKHLLCVSGRMSYDLLQKSLRAGITMVVGVGAPSSLAVSLANDFSITLVGFLRNNRYNIYSNPERILAE